METMYERIKSMTREEMQDFVYWVYKNGNLDGQDYLCDDYGNGSFFGGAMLDMDAEYIMEKLHELDNA